MHRALARGMAADHHVLVSYRYPSDQGVESTLALPGTCVNRNEGHTHARTPTRYHLAPQSYHSFEF
jgi:hypothetical protein